MLEVTFYSNCLPIISENALAITHRFNYGNIVVKMPEYEDCVKALESESEVRIWYSNSPVELSGFYWFCNLLADTGYKGKVYTEQSSKTMGKSDRCGLADEDVCKVINNRNFLSGEEIKQNSSKWKKLCAENAEYRIVKNDELISDLPDASNGLTVSEKTVLKIMNALRVTTTRAEHAAKIIGQTLMDCPNVICNDEVTFKIIKKLAAYANPYIVIHCAKEYEPSCYRYCECTFTDFGWRS
jgi:hypothetical protein